MSAGTRERSPLRVWVKSYGQAEYAWFCKPCLRFDSNEGYLSRRAAIRGASTHARSCPALRLARLEAELEKLADHLDEAAEIASNDGGNGWRARSSDYRLAALWLTAILNRHRGQADA